MGTHLQTNLKTGYSVTANLYAQGVKHTQLLMTEIAVSGVYFNDTVNDTLAALMPNDLYLVIFEDTTNQSKLGEWRGYWDGSRWSISSEGLTRDYFNSILSAQESTIDTLDIKIDRVAGGVPSALIAFTLRDGNGVLTDASPLPTATKIPVTDDNGTPSALGSLGTVVKVTTGKYTVQVTGLTFTDLEDSLQRIDIVANVAGFVQNLSGIVRIGNPRSGFDKTVDTVVTDTASRDASKATGFNTVVPDNALLTTINGKLPANTSTQLALIAGTVTIAQAVRTELIIELARIDAAISTRSSHATPDLSSLLATTVYNSSLPANYSDLAIEVTTGKVTTANPAASAGSAHTADDVAALILSNVNNLLVVDANGAVVTDTASRDASKATGLLTTENIVDLLNVQPSSIDTLDIKIDRTSAGVPTALIAFAVRDSNGTLINADITPTVVKTPVTDDNGVAAALGNLGTITNTGTGKYTVALTNLTFTGLQDSLQRIDVTLLVAGKAQYLSEVIRIGNPRGGFDTNSDKVVGVTDGSRLTAQTSSTKTLLIVTVEQGILTNNLDDALVFVTQAGRINCATRVTQVSGSNPNFTLTLDPPLPETPQAGDIFLLGPQYLSAGSI